MKDQYTVIGDLHTTHENLVKIGQIFDEVELRGKPTIWLGDLLHNKEIVRGKCFNYIHNRFRISKLKHIILIGNHDWFSSQCEAHSLETLDILSNIILVDKPTQITTGIWAIPYIRDIERLQRVLKDIPKDLVLFGHLDVQNFDYGNGHLCTSGISIDLLKKFKRVVSGHFHKFQETNNLTYLGTPFSHSFGESNQPKFIASYDSIEDTLTLKKTNFGAHITLTHNADTGLVSPNELSYTSIDFIRVIFEGTQENIERVDRSVYPENTKFIERSTDQFKGNLIIDETQSNIVKFQKWAKDIKGLDIDTIELGIKILEDLK